MTPEYAQKVIHHYILNETPTTYTITKCKYWWRIINVAIFNNKMSMPDFDIKHCKTYDGQCAGYLRPRHVRITIGSHITKKDVFISTLVHEMVHQWQFMHTASHITGHKKTFIQWKPIVEDVIGVKLSIQADGLSELTDKMQLKLLKKRAQLGKQVDLTTHIV